MSEPTMPEPASSREPTSDSAWSPHEERELDRYKAEIREAQQLLDFAISQSAAARETPIVVSDGMVSAIKEAEQQLLLERLPDPGTRTRFELAYRDLAQLVAPVTTRTLRDTTEHEEQGKVWPSTAVRWSRKMWAITASIVAYIAAVELLEGTLELMPLDEEASSGLYWLGIASHGLNLLGRYAYGALGACAYLLRSLHIVTYRREFNADRIPEYLNRILLGLVSGGAISLFVDQVMTEDGVVTLSEAALGFLAGYNCDFLFRSLERVAEAILPKVGIETVRRANSASVTAAVSLNDLLDRLSAATTDSERKLLEDLISKVKDRI